MALAALLLLVSGCSNQEVVKYGKTTGNVKHVVVFPRDGIGQYTSHDMITDILMTKDGKRLIFYGQEVHYNTLLDSRIQKIINSSMRKYVSIYVSYFYLNPGARVNVRYNLGIPNDAPAQIKGKALAMGFKEIKDNLVPKEKGSLYMNVSTEYGYVHKNNYILTRPQKSVIKPARIIVYGALDMYGGNKRIELTHTPPFQSVSDARKNTIGIPFNPIVQTDFVFKSPKGAKAYRIKLLIKDSRFRSKK